MRFLLVAQYVRARSIPESRRLTTGFAPGFGLAAICWLVSAVVPAPARFWLWAIALVIDMGTPLVTAHLTVHVPPDPAHLPERYGLFTIILLGESLVAVMKGMESQEGWSLAAALSAFLGMAMAFLVWWWYFDGAQAAAERTIRTERDARAFVVWSYAHLPLYLGIAVAGVGIEHIVKIAPDGHLHGAEAWILGGAVTLLMLALTAIGMTSERAQHDPHRRGRVVRQYGLALLPVYSCLPARRCRSWRSSLDSPRCAWVKRYWRSTSPVSRLSRPKAVSSLSFSRARRRGLARSRQLAQHIIETQEREWSDEAWAAAVSRFRGSAWARGPSAATCGAVRTMRRVSRRSMRASTMASTGLIRHPSTGRGIPRRSSGAR